MYTKRFLVYLIGVTFVPCMLAQNENISPISAALDKFSINFLAQACDLAGDSVNLALSPYTIWSLMCIIGEGAKENTAAEIQQAVGLNALDEATVDQFRKMYQVMQKKLTERTEGVSLDISSAIFTTKDQDLNPDFNRVSQNIYGVNVIPVNFNDSSASVQQINQYIASVTNGRITNFVNTGDVVDAQIFMTSALFFKGQWKTPFNKTATKRQPFYDENNKPIGNVELMYQAGVFPFSPILGMKATAVELPYGNGDGMSMIVILPRKSEKLNDILRLMTNTPISTILNILTEAGERFSDDSVHVYLPKFKVSSDLILNVVLHQMGIKDVFNEDRANLLGIFSHYLYLSRVIQKAEIEVDEEGTVATAAAGGAFQNKSPPPKFRADRPFAYFIVDKKSQAIVFAGKISNPNKLEQ